MKLDQKLVDAAIEFTKQRFPTEEWAGASAMYTDGGQVLISTSPETMNDSVSVCHEMGAICEAYKLNQKVTASVCVARDEAGHFHILTPCGVCQERLFIWGNKVEVAVPLDGDSTKWQMKLLSDVQPYYWKKPFLGKQS